MAFQSGPDRAGHGQRLSQGPGPEHAAAFVLGQCGSPAQTLPPSGSSGGQRGAGRADDCGSGMRRLGPGAGDGKGVVLFRFASTLSY